MAERIKYVPIDRSQTELRVFDLESLVAADHPVRVIWEVAGKMNLARFEEGCKSLEEGSGRPVWPARLLVSIWVYGYSSAVGSARALERMMEHEPALRWLSGDQKINHHTLADFRVNHAEALKSLFSQFLVLLEEAHVIRLSTILQDGTKVRAVAGSGSLHRKKSLQKRLKSAQHVIEELDRQAEEEHEPLDQKKQAAQRRAARQAVERATAALTRLQEWEAQTAVSKKDELRVSTSEAEAVKMKHGDGGVSPSYNVQISTELQSGMIVGIGVTTASNDLQELLPAIERVEETTGHKPKTVIADTGYATRSNVEKTSEQGITMIAPWKEDASREAGACVRNDIAPGFWPSAFQPQSNKELVCPAGKTLVLIGQRKHHGVQKDVFSAREEDCAACAWRRQCCGLREGPRQVRRVVETKAMKKYLARMDNPRVQELYKKRSQIAEFPHLWAKAVKKWRRFSVRGVIKAGSEALWVALAYNISQWIGLGAPVAMAA